MIKRPMQPNKEKKDTNPTSTEFINKKKGEGK